MQRSSILILLSVLAATAYLKPAGVAASVDADVIKRFKDFAMPRFVSEINSI